MSGYTYYARSLTGYRWQRNPHTGRWEVYAPAATSPCATASSWRTAAAWALQQRHPTPPAPLHSAQTSKEQT